MEADPQANKRPAYTPRGAPRRDQTSRDRGKYMREPRAKENIQLAEKGSFNKNADNSMHYCYECAEGIHHILDCQIFNKMNFRNQNKFCEKHNICRVCREKGHQSHQCKNSFNICKRCQSENHCTALCYKVKHSGSSTQQQVSTANIEKHEDLTDTDFSDFEEGNIHAVKRHEKSKRGSHRIFGYVKMADVNLKKQMRALVMFDTASNITLVAKQACTRLGISTGRQETLIIGGINDRKARKVQRANFKLCREDGIGDWVTLENIAAVKDLGIPEKSLPTKKLVQTTPALEDLPWPDDENLQCVLLIGTDTPDLLALRHISNPRSHPGTLIHDTPLGITIGGKLGEQQDNPIVENHACVTHNEYPAAKYLPHPSTRSLGHVKTTTEVACQVNTLELAVQRQSHILPGSPKSLDEDSMSEKKKPGRKKPFNNNPSLSLHLLKILLLILLFSVPSASDFTHFDETNTLPVCSLLDSHQVTYKKQFLIQTNLWPNRIQSDTLKLSINGRTGHSAKDDHPSLAITHHNISLERQRPLSKLTTRLDFKTKNKKGRVSTLTRVTIMKNQQDSFLTGSSIKINPEYILFAHHDSHDKPCSKFAQNHSGMNSSPDSINIGCRKNQNSSVDCFFVPIHGFPPPNPTD